MFSSDLDRGSNPLRTRLWGVFLGMIVMLLIMAALISPRTLPFSVPVLFIAAIYGAGMRNQHKAVIPALGGGSLSVLGYVSFAAVSGLWATVPYAAPMHAVTAGLFCVAAGLISRAFLMEPRRNIFHVAEGVWLGFAIGLLYLLIEFLTHQTIKIHLYNALELVPGILRPPTYFKWDGPRLVSIAPDDLTRNMAPVTLWLWPAFLAIKGSVPRRLGTYLTAALFVLAAAVIFKSEHETSKASLIGGGLIFVLALYVPLWSERLLRVTWVLACLATIPVALLLFRANLQSAKWVQPTFQHRIMIWNYTAEQTLKSPVFGIGAGMMYELYGPHPTEGTPEAYDPHVPHAHSVYLQTWFELGVIGAALLTLLGLAVLERLRLLGPHIAPYGQATFASAAIMAAASYGIWQLWFLGMYAVTIILFAIGLRSVIRHEQVTGLPASFA